MPHFPIQFTLQQRYASETTLKIRTNLKMSVMMKSSLLKTVSRPTRMVAAKAVE